MNTPRQSSQNSGCTLSRARTRPHTGRFLPELAGGSRSRPLLGSPLPLESAQELSGNVSNHQPTVLRVRHETSSFVQVKNSHEGLRGWTQFLPGNGQ